MLSPCPSAPLGDPNHVGRPNRIDVFWEIGVDEASRRGAVRRDAVGQQTNTEISSPPTFGRVVGEPSYPCPPSTSAIQIRHPRQRGHRPRLHPIMLPQPSSSRSKLASHEDHHVVPHSISLRRLLSRLDKAELIALVARWLDNAGPSFLPPMLSRRQPRAGEDDPASNLMLYHSILDLNEERRCRSLDELRLLWTGPMADPKVPKARAVDRITDVDWPEGLSYAMVAELDLFGMHARPLSKTWTTVRLEYDDDVDASARGWERLTEAQIRTRLSSELAHYFEHHIYLYPRSPRARHQAYRQAVHQSVDRRLFLLSHRARSGAKRHLCGGTAHPPSAAHAVSARVRQPGPRRREPRDGAVCVCVGGRRSYTQLRQAHGWLSGRGQAACTAQRGR
ncbi:hypothetical protein L1887_53369 [Cichorium endivia]|nr:hypothetical protein L1887_53369 [Cichorium endivia]